MPLRSRPFNWEAIIDLAHDAIFIRGADDRILHWNTGAERLYGWSKREALDRSPHELLHTRFPSSLAEVLAEVRERDVWVGLLRQAAKDGRELLVESKWTAVRSREGELEGFCEINRDVSARAELQVERRLRAEAEALSQELQREQKEREMFLAVLGHDLRNPLGAIDLAAHGLLRREDLPDPVLRTASRIVSSCTRMRRLIEQLLDFARARYGGGIPVDKRPMNIHDVCGDVIADAELQGWAERIDFESEGDGEGMWDRDRMFQVVQNLVHNAIKFAAPGSRVRIKVRPIGPGMTELCIHNDGEPIPEAIRPFIFDPFRRGAAEVTAKGIGLGLFIAQQIVLAHGGAIEVDSRPGYGTTFRVRLPGALHET